MADKKKMSVEEILAAARKTDGAGGSAPAAKPAAAPKPTATPAEESAGDESPAPAAPKSAAAKPAVPGSSMSVADVLAAARAGKASAAAPAAPKEQAPAAVTPKKAAPKPAAAKPAAPAKDKKDKDAAKPAAAAADKGAGPKDTASILAAARAAAKPGPISKSELAARSKEVSLTPTKKKPSVPAMPEKPEYARPAAAAQAVPSTERRSFLQGVAAGIVAASAGSALAIGFSSLAVTFNLWVLGFARFMFPNILIEPPTKFKVGFPNELATGQVQTKFVPQFGVWIVRYEYDGTPQIYALQTVCTHLGCTPNWLEGEQKFKCPCHGSGFYKDGINFEGPAPRPLERFAIRLADDGQLEVDKSRKFKEELGQWREAASFVPV